MGGGLWRILIADGFGKILAPIYLSAGTSNARSSAGSDGEDKSVVNTDVIERFSIDTWPTEECPEPEVILDCPGPDKACNSCFRPWTIVKQPKARHWWCSVCSTYGPILRPVDFKVIWITGMIWLGT